MAGAEIDRPLQFSVFDRLLIGEREPHEAGVGDVELLRAFVLRDLQWLLNTRQMPRRMLDGYPELQASAMAYGFTDITSLGRDSPQVRTRLMSQIEEALMRFEPRLTNLRVTVPMPPAGVRHQLRFVIQGTLRADPLPIQFSFDTVIDKLKGEVALSEAGGST